MKKLVMGAVCAVALVLGSHAAQADSAGVSDHVLNSTSRGIAMDGFDMVAYFTEGKPAKGTMEHRTEYKDRIWVFSSAENLNLFKENPEAYAPQNNGWCSWAVANGYAAEVDFVNGWFIDDDKLYLNWSEEVKDRYLAKKDEMLALTHANWEQVHTGLQDGSTDFFPHSAKPELGFIHPQPLPES
ncbi:YHS domain protein [Rhodobacteraceae bacterium KLH11]|nr:YHS domain protein [Rhodobacteraceae bacterium KLH11]